MQEEKEKIITEKRIPETMKCRTVFFSVLVADFDINSP